MVLGDKGPCSYLEDLTHGSAPVGTIGFMNVDELVMLPKDGGGLYWETPTAARAAAMRSLNILPSESHSVLEKTGCK